MGAAITPDDWSIARRQTWSAPKRRGFAASARTGRGVANGELSPPAYTNQIAATLAKARRPGFQTAVPRRAAPIDYLWEIVRWARCRLPWLVHALTASGALLAFMALDAIIDG